MEPDSAGTRGLSPSCCSSVLGGAPRKLGLEGRKFLRQTPEAWRRGKQGWEGRLGGAGLHSPGTCTKAVVLGAAVSPVIVLMSGSSCSYLRTMLVAASSFPWGRVTDICEGTRGTSGEVAETGCPVDSCARVISCSRQDGEPPKPVRAQSKAQRQSRTL